MATNPKEAIKRNQDLLYRRALTKLQAEQTLDKFELAEVERREKEKEKKRLGTVNTKKAAMVKTGLKAHEIKWASDGACPALKTNGRVDCDLLVSWMAEHPMPQADAEDVPNYHVERAKDIRANRMLKEQKLAERGKLLLPIEAIRRAWARNVIACKTKFYAAENEVAVECGMKLGLTTQQVTTLKEILMKRNRAAIKELHVGEFGKVECPNCKGEITQ